MFIFNRFHIILIGIYLCAVAALAFEKSFVMLGVSLILGVVFIMVLRKMGQHAMELNRKVEESLEYKRQNESLKEKLEEKSNTLSQKIAESNIQRRITKSMISSMDLSKVLAVILGAVIEIARHDRAILFLLNEDESFLEAKQAVGFPHEKVNNIRLPMNKEGNPFYKSMKECRPIILADAGRYRAQLEAFADGSDHFPDEIVSNPLVAQDKVVGLILVDHLKTRRAFEEEDLRNLLSYTQLAGMAVLNARLFQTEKNFHVELAKEVEKARNELLSAQEMLIQSERLAALGEMAAVVAHEVKNPMASIRACAQSIDKSIKKGEAFDQKYLYYIHKEIDRLDNIVRSILIYSRPPKPKLLSFDLNIIVDETLDFMKKEFQKEKIKLETILTPGTIKVMIDPEQTKQILINLLKNSIHFVKDKKEKIITVKTSVSDSEAVLSVEDTGGGIDPAIINKIFEPFFTTKTQGTGLGLAICDKIVHSENGRIAVNNNPGTGIRMDVIFPLVKKS